MLEECEDCDCLTYQPMEKWSGIGGRLVPNQCTSHLCLFSMLAPFVQNIKNCLTSTSL